MKKLNLIQKRVLIHLIEEELKTGKVFNKICSKKELESSKEYIEELKGIKEILIKE